MTAFFSIEYKTLWGENIILVIDGHRIPMAYANDGLWTAEYAIENNGQTKSTSSKGNAGIEYHYELEKDGVPARRELQNHVLVAGKGRKTRLEFHDRWLDVPGAYANLQQGKCAGTAVPVFSLRSRDSFGIGDFHDLRKLVDWIAATGQRIIQLLPINDTTLTGTWTDSYPYSANSIYALHPQLVYLPAAGVRKDAGYKKIAAELNALPQVDYERVNAEKDRLMRKAFAQTWEKVSASRDFARFLEDNSFWLNAYCAFRILRDKFGNGDISKWGKYSVYDAKKIAKLLADNKEEADYHTFVQYHLHKQLVDAHDYAKSKGIMFKGDLPIGVSRCSVDAWQNPEQFHMDSQAGAPPDAFAADGQNWGFPTYNWEYMAGDNYSWWKARLHNMEQYFDAFRIDHVLGFFRIWEIPAEHKSGLMGHFNPALPYSTDELRHKGFDPYNGAFTGDGLDTLFLEDPHRQGWWHPRIAAQDTEKYRNLQQWQKDAYNALYNDFFYHRHNGFWKDTAMRKLPELLASTSMLACGEDLGMIPDCVPEVMGMLKILSLEIQRMPKDDKVEFADTWKYPQLSVCATSTHDMSPLRAWWHEDSNVTQRFWNQVLGQPGQAPADCTPEICRSIIMMHLQSASLFAILPLQDWLSIRPELCSANPDDERINVPAISPFYWRYRMHIDLEDLLENDVTPYVAGLIRECGR